MKLGISVLHLSNLNPTDNVADIVNGYVRLVFFNCVTLSSIRPPELPYSLSTEEKILQKYRVE